MSSTSPEHPDGARSTPEPASPPTSPVDTTETRAHPVSRRSAHSGEPPAAPVEQSRAPVEREEWRASAHGQQNALSGRPPSGISWPTVVFGAVALVVGLLVLALQTLDLSIDWSSVVPAVIVVIGAVLIGLGVAGLFTRREHDSPETSSPQESAS